MYLDTVVIAGVLVVAATTVVVAGVIAFIIKDVKKSPRSGK